MSYIFDPVKYKVVEVSLSIYTSVIIMWDRTWEELIALGVSEHHILEHLHLEMMTRCSIDLDRLIGGFD